jgi:hypothetical protein
MRSLLICTSHQYYSSDQIEKNERGRAGNVPRMGERRGTVHTGFWWGNLKERDHLDGPGVEGRIVLRLTFRKWVGGGGGHGLD